MCLKRKYAADVLASIARSSCHHAFFRYIRFELPIVKILQRVSAIIRSIHGFDQPHVSGG
jgi:hypothetical protein